MKFPFSELDYDNLYPLTLKLESGGIYEGRFTDLRIDRIKNKTSDYIRIMSIHSSTGLEFDTVFLIGAQEGILPDLSHDNVDLDEEANLAYVASTRAKENLFISYPRHNSKCKDEIAPSRYFAPFFH